MCKITSCVLACALSIPCVGMWKILRQVEWIAAKYVEGKPVTSYTVWWLNHRNLLLLLPIIFLTWGIALTARRKTTVESVLLFLAVGLLLVLTAVFMGSHALLQIWSADFGREPGMPP